MTSTTMGDEGFAHRVNLSLPTYKGLYDRIGGFIDMALLSPVLRSSVHLWGSGGNADAFYSTEALTTSVRPQEDEKWNRKK